MISNDHAILTADDEIVRRLADAADPDLVSLIYQAGRRPIREAVPNLLLLLDSPDAELQQQALEALGDIGDEQAAPHILTFLDREPSEVSLRDTAAWALGLLRHRAATSRLERMLRDNEPTVRSCAAAALVAIGDRATAPALHLALALEADEAVRQDFEKAAQCLTPARELQRLILTPGLRRAAAHPPAPVKEEELNDSRAFEFHQDLPPTGTLG
jgi:HEAT repeat protein